MGFFNGKDINEKKGRVPQPAIGRHLLIIEELSIFKTREHGECPQVKFRVKQSEAEPIGKQVGKIYFIHSGATEMARAYTRGDFIAIGRAIMQSLGQDPNVPANEVDEFLGSLYYHAPYVQNQQVRGLALWCDAVQAETKAKRTVTNLTFHGFAQTGDDIARERAWVESEMAKAAPPPSAHPFAPGASAPQPPPVGVPVAASPPVPVPGPALPAQPAAPPVAAVPAAIPPTVPAAPVTAPAAPQQGYQPAVGKQNILDKLNIGK